MDLENLKTIIKAFDIEGVISVNPIEKGLINKTFLVETDKNKYILQKLHRIFPDSVTEDIDVVSSFLRDNGLITPLLIHRNGGGVLYKQGSDSWRMMTFIEGRTFDAIPGIEFADSAGRLVGRFHRVLSALDYRFEHKSQNWHRTEFFMDRLCSSLKGCEDKKILSIKNDILKSYQLLEIPEFNPRHILHGDLKFNNILFGLSENKAICLIDLDTLRKGSISLEMGDAVRSWCNPGGEDSGHVYFDMELFSAAMEGYFHEASRIVGDRELLAVPASAAAIALELSSRFLEDAYTQSYFQLDSRNYDTLYEQNLNKSGNQLKLFYDIKRKEEKAGEIIKGLIKD
ncbi:MAG: phosphotransferase enzyme family protein [bacterium]